MPNLYDILGVGPDASKAVIKKQYKQLAQIYHPDNLETGDIETFQLIKMAYDTLKDDKKRKYYDKTGAVASDVTNMESAESNLEVLFVAVVEHNIKNLDTVNIIDLVTDSVLLNIEKTKNQMRLLNDQLESLLDCQPRVKSDNKVLEKVLIDKVAKTRADISTSLQQAEILKIMHVMITEYVYKTDVKVNPQYSMGTTTIRSW